MSNLTTIANLLRRFSPAVLRNLIPMVMDIKWDQIERILFQNKLSLQKKFIVQAAVYLFEDKKPTKEDLEILVKKLKFLDIVSNPKLEWQCAKLVDQIADLPGLWQLENNIINAYKQEGRTADVLVYEEDPLMFVKISDKKRKQLLSVYFAFRVDLTNDKYFFYASTFTKNENQIDHFCTALGYESYSSVPLSGKDVRNLFQLIKNSQENVDLSTPQFDPVRIVEDDCVVDFTLGDERCKYAEKVFHGLTNFNTFTIHANNTWKGGHDISCDDNDRFLTALTFSVTRKGHSVENIFKELIKAGAVKIPLPHFLASMTKVPKNNVSLHEENSDDSVMDISY